MSNVCFWCAESKNEHYAINAGDLQHCYDLCEECERVAEEGVMFVETSHTPIVEGMPPINKDGAGQFVFPTANHVCLTVEGAEHLLPAFKEKLRKGDRFCMDSTVFHKVFRGLAKDLKGE